MDGDGLFYNVFIVHASHSLMVERIAQQGNWKTIGGNEVNAVIF
jgi:hypothetical protein